MVLAGASLPARAEAAPASAERIARLEREIQVLSAERDRLRADEKGVLGRLETLSAEARLADARLERLETMGAETSRALEDLDRRRREQEVRLEQERARLRRTVLLLAQAGPFGRLRLLLDVGDAEQLAGAWRLVYDLTARQRTEVAAVRRSLAEAERLGRERRVVAAEMDRLTAEAAAERDALRATIAQRRRLLDDLRREGEQREQAIAELARASRELAKITAGGSAPRPVTLNINRFKGLLAPPAKGAVVRAFGDRREPRFGVVLPHRGWDIDAAHGAEVRAVFDGRVVWASWFRGYGLMVVIDHGDGVHSVYAHLSAIVVANGGEVSRGQVIGRVGDTVALGGPGLYLEIRRAGRAEDPANWIRRPPPGLG